MKKFKILVNYQKGDMETPIEQMLLEKKNSAYSHTRLQKTFNL